MAGRNASAEFSVPAAMTFPSAVRLVLPPVRAQAQVVFAAAFGDDLIGARLGRADFHFSLARHLPEILFRLAKDLAAAGHLRAHVHTCGARFESLVVA